MKNCKAVLLCVLVVCFYCGCSDKKQIAPVTNQETTLKGEITKRKQDTLWTSPIESDADLSVKKKEGSVLFASVQGSVPLYPYIQDFGSLDTSVLTVRQKNVLNQLCRAIQEQSSDQTFMAKGYEYVYFFANKDIQAVLGGTPDRWMLGKPFTLEQVLRIPVRFYVDEHYCDCMVYLDVSALDTIVQIYTYAKSK